ncbi:SRPBCC family protein [Cellulomonas sp. zg-ZUI199]|uniref:SRPBCC family protein n=1 Tax=Cellulomonas wangleii TaxID=2816956 RepID=A0ABX8D539_9CELL|nr:MULTISPECIES: SRPBCC family protein [Cellulomonas]MBO0898399.1 SRPBCC family protein [Cellulomonas sp. zg-ZUI22]MBO0924593.1 SRPBCC family protein [Cellulomonas wangleii]QVI62573.1 SRPBCC family protein [Cellulomonas wangleii]
MSRVNDALSRWQQTVTAAQEEAHRVGHAEVDLDHLVVALAAIGGPAGESLRAAGVSLDAARRAAARVHADRLAGAGVAVTPTPPRALDVVAAPSLPLSPRVERLIRRMSELSADDRALLRILVDEPSGLVVEMLAALDVVPDAVRAAADAWRPAPTPSDPLYADDPAWSPWRTLTCDGWVPAAPERVWALLADPARRTEWDPWYSTVTQRPDGSLLCVLRSEEDGGKRVPADMRRQLLTVVTRDEGRLVEWEIARPDRDGGAAIQRLAVALSPSGAGTRLDVTVRWLPRHGWRRLVGWVLRPVGRWMYRQMVLQKLGSISRALR